MSLTDLLRSYVRRIKGDVHSAKRKGSFARHVFYSMSDAMVSIVAQLVLTPLVARVYGPEAYGIYGLFISITMNLSMVAGGSYPNALLLVRDDEGFARLARAITALTCVMVVAMMPFFLWQDLLFTLVPSWSILGHWTYAIPFMVLVLGIMQLFYGWVARSKAFALNAKLGPATNILLRLSNLGLGYASKGASYGLMLGEMVVRTLSMTAYAIGLRRHSLKVLRGPYSLKETWATLVEHRRQPMYIFPSRWLAMLSSQVPVFGLAALNDAVAVGQFTMGSSLLLMPLRLLGYSLSGVIYQKASESLVNAPGSVGQITLRLYKRLMLLGVVPFTFITIFGDVLFRFFLGEEWTLAGGYTAALGLFYYFRLLSEPFVTLFSVVGQERRMFSFYAWCMIANLAVAAAAVMLFGSAEALVLGFAACNTLLYLQLSARLLSVSGVQWLRPTLLSLGAAFLGCTFFAAVRWMILGTLLPGF